MNPHYIHTRKAIFLILIFLLAIMTFTTQAQEGDFFDPFDDPALPGWERSPGVLATDSIMRIPPGQNAIYPMGWGDVRIITQLRWDGEGEFILGSRIAEGGYLHLVGRDYIVAQRMQGEMVTELATATGIEVPYMEWFQLEVLLQGNTQQVFMNDVLVLEKSDPVPLPRGGILFEALGGASLEIENLAIYLDGGGENVSFIEPTPTEGEHVELEEEETKPDEEEQAEVIFEGEQIWIRTGGPPGGFGYDIRMNLDNPDTMYVTDGFAGLFKSIDGGNNWFPVNDGITVRIGPSGDQIPIFCLTIDPTNPDTIWAGTQNKRGIFKSEDGGASWVIKVNGIEEAEGITFRGITVDPNNPEVIFTAAEIHSWLWKGEEDLGRGFDKTKGVVYKSTNGGESWKAIWRGDNLARYILIDPRESNVLYISTGIFDREAANSDHTTNTPGGEGVLKSTDGGQTWTSINNGLTNLYIGTLDMHPDNPDILLAGAANNAYRENAGVFLTTNGGQSWTRVREEEAHSVAFSPSNPMIAYAGNPYMIFRSTDGGFTWDMVLPDEGWGSPGIEAGFPIDFEVDPRNPDRIFANNYGGGNFLSEDGGRTWKDASVGYTGSIMRGLAVSPTEPGVVYAVGRSGIFVSTNGGRKWDGLIYPEAYGLEWNSVAIDPEDPRHILGANNWSQSVYESFDGGLSWSTKKFQGLGLDGGRVISFAPSDPKVVYLGFGVYLTAGNFDDTRPGSGVYISRNGGDTWAAANDEITESANISDLTIHPTDSRVVIMALPSYGLVKTMDSGGDWIKLGGGLPDNVRPLSVAIDPHNPDLVLMGSDRQGLYRSSDGGQSWTQVYSGLPAEATISTVLFHPITPGTVFCGDMFSGVYRSSDSGQSWLLMSNGLRTRTVTSLAISGDGLHLYAATEGEGVFRLDFNGRPPEADEMLFEEYFLVDEMHDEEGMESIQEGETQPEEEPSEPKENGLVATSMGQRNLVYRIAIGAGVTAVVAVFIFKVTSRKKKKE